MKESILTVQGMSCGHCVSSIEGGVGKLNGVETVKVDLGEGKVNVKYDESTVSLETIKEEIDDLGYDIA